MEDEVFKKELQELIGMGSKVDKRPRAEKKVQS